MPASGQPLLVRRPGMPKARSGQSGRLHRQQELRSVTAVLTGPRSQPARRAVPGAYTFADDAHGLSRLRLRRPRHSGLDQCASMFAPCLLGCPGTPRYDPVSAERRGHRATGQNGSSRHVIALFGSSSRRINEQSSGLLIRGFGVQIPGGAPGLTWSYNLSVIRPSS